MRNGTMSRIRLGTGAALIAFLPAAAFAATMGQQERPQLRYVAAGPEGALARNLNDRDGVSVGRVPAGGILAVHGENRGWLEVERPGGFEVWVFGQFVRATDETGVYEVTRNGVLQRPLPSSTPDSWPLSQKLFAGDRVRFIRRQDPARPLGQDWVQVWSPPGVRAWVSQSETTALPSGAQGSVLWAEAVLSAENRSGSGSTGGGVQAGEGSEQLAQAQRALNRANDVLAAERDREDPDFAAARAAFQEVLELSDTGATAELAKARLQEVDSLEEAMRLRAELEAERAEIARRSSEREEAIREAGKDRDPLDGRFLSRGWLEPAPGELAEEGVWIVRWGGLPVAEVVCPSGRYELEIFSGYDLGIDGAAIRPGGARVGAAPLPRIEITRIEVISGRRER